MAKSTFNSIKLGLFVLAGLLFLLVLLYLIGKNENMFGASFRLKARFSHVQGLVAGNNVRYAGIQTGTVKKIDIVNDTTIEVTMLIDKKMQGIIRKNAIVSIGTDGFVGNKVVNINATGEEAPLAKEGDILPTKKAVDTDEILQTLSKSNQNIASITQDLKSTVQRINSSNALWSLLSDEGIPQDFRASIARIKMATGKAQDMATNLNSIVLDVKNGKGSAGQLLTDTSFAVQLNHAVSKITQVGVQADSLAVEISRLVSGVRENVQNGNGPANALLKDTSLVYKLHNSLDNIQKGTEGFNQNMEALKHNFFFRSYFKKQERKKEREARKD